MAFPFTKTNWVNGSQPAISAQQLNRIEDALEQASQAPSVNNGVLTIKSGDETVGTFSANSNSDVTVTLPAIDDTLSVEGAAADAKVTGIVKDSVSTVFTTKQVDAGGIASFKNGAKDIPLKSLVVSIEPKQSGSGDPSPSNVRAISGWTAANITRCGKNYLQSELADGTYYGMRFTNVKNAAGVITGFLINGTSTGSPGTLPVVKYYQPNNIKMVVECTTPTNIAFRWRTRWKNNGVVQGSSSDTWFYTKNGRQELSLSVPPGYDEYDACFVFSNGVTCDNLAISAMIVNANETDDTFEPYNGNTYNVSFGSAGTVYGGILDVTTGMLTVTHAIVDMGTLSWSRDTTTRSADGATIHAFYGYLYAAKKIGTAIPNMYSSQFTADTVNQVDYGGGSTIKDNICSGADGNGRVWAYGSTYNNMTATEFKTAMNGVQLCYELANPTSVQLTATEVRTLLGNNNIWSDTGSVLECEYRRDLQEQLLSMLVTESASGNVASFTDGADDVPLKDLVVNITPKQAGSGDPSPSNVRAISGWTGANIYSRSINIWDEEWVLGYYKTTDGTFVANTSGYIASKNKIAVKPSTHYFFYTNAIRFEVFEYGADKAFLRRSVGNANNGLINTSADAYYITFSSHANNYGATYNYDLSLNYPSTDTAYHASNLDSTVYNISFGSAGTVYGGTLDVTSGMLTVTWASVDISTLGWYAAASGYGFQRFTASLTSKANGNSNMLCSRYKTMISADGSAQEDYSIKGNNTANYIYARDDSCATVDAFRTANSGVPLVYELAQPVSYQLTATEIKTLLANNNIWSDTGSVESCEYRADTGILITKLTNAIISLGGNV